jgi:hypothetical protein
LPRLPPSSLRGTIIAVIDHYFNNYAINIKFEKLMSPTAVQDIIRS